jgi:hypothetical protein
LNSLEEDYGGEERENGKKGPEKNEVDVHGGPFRGEEAQAWIAVPFLVFKASAMFLIAAGSGLRGRGTLEEGGRYVVAKGKTPVVSW